MTNKNFIDFLHENTPLDFARMMFEKSSEDGVLILRNWYDVDCEDLLTYNDYRIKINWSEEDLNKAIDIYTKLYNEIGIISKYYDELDGTYETATKVLKDKSILHTYNCFIAPFDIELFCRNRLSYFCGTYTYIFKCIFFGIKAQHDLSGHGFLKLI